MSLIDNHPCKPCAWFMARDVAGLSIQFPACVNRERIKGIERGWTPTNRKGPECKGYAEGKFTTIEDFAKTTHKTIPRGGEKKNG